MGLIWDHIRRSLKSKHLPLIYPMILYNGDAPYAHSLILSDLIQPAASKAIFENLFTQPFCLVDLNAIQDEALRKGRSTV